MTLSRPRRSPLREQNLFPGKMSTIKLFDFGPLLKREVIFELEMVSYCTRGWDRAGSSGDATDRTSINVHAWRDGILSRDLCPAARWFSVPRRVADPGLGTKSCVCHVAMVNLEGWFTSPWISSQQGHRTGLHLVNAESPFLNTRVQRSVHLRRLGVHRFGKLGSCVIRASLCTSTGVALLSDTVTIGNKDIFVGCDQERQTTRGVPHPCLSTYCGHPMCWGWVLGVFTLTPPLDLLRGWSSTLTLVLSSPTGRGSCWCGCSTGVDTK